MRTIKYFDKEISVDEFIKQQIIRNDGTRSLVYKHKLVEECEKRNIKTAVTSTKEQLTELLADSGMSYKELADRIHIDDQTISRIINCKRDPQINTLVLICLGMHLPPEISLFLIEKSSVSLNFSNPNHIWYNFALVHLSKQSMTSIEKFFQEHNVQI